MQRLEQLQEEVGRAVLVTPEAPAVKAAAEALTVSPVQVRLAV
jgi:hypothetical protein